MLYNMVTRIIVPMATKLYRSLHRGMTWGEINYLVLKFESTISPSLFLQPPSLWTSLTELLTLLNFQRVNSSSYLIMTTPTLINLPPPPSDPVTPSDMGP